MNHAVDNSIPLVNSRLVDEFMPDDPADESAGDELRARLLVLSIFLFVAWAPLNAVFYYAIDATAIGAVVVAMSLASAIPLYISRETGRFDVIGHFMCFTSTATLVMVSLVTGGLESLAIYWLLIPPVFALVFIDRRSSGIWAASSLVVLGVIATLHWTGYVPESNLSDDIVPFVNLFSAASFIGLTYLLLNLHARLGEWAETSLRETQRQMLESTKKGFHKLIEKTPDGILVHRDGIIKYANPAAADCLGVEEVDDLVGAPVLPFMSEDGSYEANDASVSVNFKTGETVVRRLDGSEIPVELTEFVAPFDSETSVITVMRDLSERREMRSQMMRMDRMAAVGTLAAGVGHEINNPLAFVMGNLQFVRSLSYELPGSPDQDPDVADMQAAISDALEGAQRIERIVADLRTFSLEDSRAPGVADVQESLESAIKMAANEIRHRANLVRDFEEIPDVFADEASLGQIFLNLLINAAQAVSMGGAEYDEIEIRTRHRDGRVEVSISDTGIGMDAETQARIFDPFYTTKSPDSGTGLGLAVCQNIIEELGGTIDVESSPGEGATFTVSLPAAAGDSSGSTSGEHLPPRDVSGLRALRVMIVDDEPEVCKMLERLLSAHFQTVAYTDANEALEALADGLEVDVVLTDLLMPSMSGIELHEELSAVAPHLSEHTVFMTGGAFTDEASHFLENTDKVVIRKPCDLDELISALREAGISIGLDAAS